MRDHTQANAICIAVYGYMEATSRIAASRYMLSYEKCKRAMWLHFTDTDARSRTVTDAPIGMFKNRKPHHILNCHF